MNVLNVVVISACCLVFTAVLLALGARWRRRRFFRQMTGITQTPPARLTFLLIEMAVREKASKVVFGEPREKESERIPYEPPTSKPPCDTPWDAENRESFSGRSDASRIEERRRQIEAEGSRWQGPYVPVWIKVGQSYKGLQPLPGHLLLPLLKVLESWDGRMLTEREAGWDVSLKPEVSADLCGPYLFQCAIQYSSGTNIQVSLGLEPNAVFSLLIRYTGSAG